MHVVFGTWILCEVERYEIFMVRNDPRYLDTRLSGST